MNKSISVSILALVFCMNAFAQKNVYLTVKHKLGANPFAFNQSATNDLNNNLSVKRIDYYMSKFIIIHDGGQTLNVPDSVIILAKGANNVIKNLGNYNVTNVEGITFSIGVPQTYNHSDPTLYGSSNPLSPQSPSMQWGWTAGYRFVALEGRAGASLSTDYQMHGLADANYFSQTKMATGVVTGNNIYVNLDADYTKALKGINVTLGPIDHGVNATDLTVLQNFRDFVFSPGAGFSTGIQSLTKDSGISVYPNPNNGDFFVTATNSQNELNSIEIMDITGRTVSILSLANTKVSKINIPNKGMYFMLLKTKKEEVFYQKVLVN